MKNALVSLCAVCLVVLLAAPAGADDEKKGGKMSYMIETTHTPEECLRDLDMVVAETPKLLDKVDWGCGSGVHSGWLIVSAGSEKEAREMLPKNLREKAKVVQLNKYTAEQIRSFHAKK